VVGLLSLSVIEYGMPAGLTVYVVPQVLALFGRARRTRAVIHRRLPRFADAALNAFAIGDRCTPCPRSCLPPRAA
jgi:hypothetical protein